MTTNVTEPTNGVTGKSQENLSLKGMTEKSNESEMPFDMALEGNKKPTEPKTEEPKAATPTEPKTEEPKTPSEPSTPEAVEIDGTQYRLDKDGNALGEDGKVVKTKEELDALVAAQTNEELPPLPVELAQKIGITPLDEEGKPKTYEDTVEGLMALVNDVAEIKQRANEKEFFDKLPAVRDFAEFLINGGKEEDYFKAKTSSWKNVSLKEADENFKLNVVIEDLKAKGFDLESAKETALLYRDSNKLDEKSKAALKARQDAETANEKTRRAAFEKTRQEEELATKQYYDNVKAIVDKGSLRDIVIPEADRQKFFEYYAFDADGQGNSQAMLDLINGKPEEILQAFYLNFKKFNLDTLVRNKAATEKANTIRMRLKSESKKPESKGVDTSGAKTNPKDFTPSINDLM